MEHAATTHIKDMVEMVGEVKEEEAVRAEAREEVAFGGEGREEERRARARAQSQRAGCLRALAAALRAARAPFSARWSTTVA